MRDARREMPTGVRTWGTCLLFGLVFAFGFISSVTPSLSECVYSWMLRNAPPGARRGSSSRRDIDRNSHRGKAMSLSASQALAARRSRVAIPEDAHFVGVAGNKKEMTTVGRFPGVAATACLLRMRRTA